MHQRESLPDKWKGRDASGNGRGEGGAMGEAKERSVFFYLRNSLLGLEERWGSCGT